MAGKTNTTRIEDLEALTNNLSARLDVQVIQIQGITELLKKAAEAATSHTEKLIVIEHKILVLADVKGCVEAIAAIRQDLIGIKRDVEGLGKWKDDLKKERDESARRLWSFGPNVVCGVYFPASKPDASGKRTMIATPRF